MSTLAASAWSWAAVRDGVAQAWDASLLGVSLGDLVLAGAVMLAAHVFRRTMSDWILAKMKALAASRGMTVAGRMVDAVGPPLTYVPSLLAGYFVVHQLGWSGEAREGGFVPTIADNLLTTAASVLVFWALLRVVDPVLDAATALRRVLTTGMFDWIRRGLRIFLIFVGGAAILELWGIPVGPILASLGIFGVAVALGAQDLFKNLIAGFLILSERRFEAGEWIQVDGVVEGTVERIGFRSTHVRRFDKGPVFIPNAMLADNPLVNFSRMSHRRIYWIIGIEYNASLDQLRQIRDGIAEYLENSEEFAAPPEAAQFVRIDKFNDSSVDIMMYCFTHTTKWGEWLEIKERLALKVKAIVEGAGVGFAFPSRTIYLSPTDSAAAPEVFQPPAQTAPPRAIAKADAAQPAARAAAPKTKAKRKRTRAPAMGDAPAEDGGMDGG